MRAGIPLLRLATTAVSTAAPWKRTSIKAVGTFPEYVHVGQLTWYIHTVAGVLQGRCVNPPFGQFAFKVFFPVFSTRPEGHQSINTISLEMCGITYMYVRVEPHGVPSLTWARLLRFR